MSRSPRLDEEVAVLTRNSEFGDAGLQEAMRARLRDRLEKARAEQRGLRVYAGLDPTAPDLHLGHAALLRKLREFTAFGHDVTVVIGTMTALIGDTSDKTSGRPARSRDEVREAAVTYADQLYRVLDREAISIAFNDEWLGTMDLSAVVQSASAFTVQQFLARDSYRARLDRGDPIGLQEFLYALLQACDAVQLQCEVQVGGTDQLFNILAGARLQEVLGQPPSVALTLPLLVGTDGAEKMSKSAGNTIGIAETPAEQFGKTMSISDETMLTWAPLVTEWDSDELASFLAAVRSGSLHPMEAKKRLAAAIVAGLHGPKAAESARENFEQVHQRGDVPADLPEVTIRPGTTLIDVIVQNGLAKSRSDARRLVMGSGVTLDGEKVTDPSVTVESGSVIQVGPRRFLRVRTT